MISVHTNDGMAMVDETVDATRGELIEAATLAKRKHDEEVALARLEYDRLKRALDRETQGSDDPVLQHRYHICASRLNDQARLWATLQLESEGVL